MVRVGGINYTCDLTKGFGKRINNMMLNGKALDLTRNIKLPGWAPVAEGVVGEPILMWFRLPAQQESYQSTQAEYA
jgi:sulfur-oxidizing protein SoxB